MAAATAAATAAGAPSGAGDPATFLSGLWSAGASMLLSESTSGGGKSEEGSGGRRAFEDLDMLESGMAREYITDEYLLPSPNLRKWTTCNVVKEGKTVFRMYLDDSQTRFMLSAKRVGDAFYISQYETFPETVEGEAEPAFHYCAVLRTCADGHFKLFLNGCEACDKRVDKYTCGGPAGCEDQRQLLAEVFHSVRQVKEANADMRCLSVKLPAVHEDRTTRDVWCPRMDQMRRTTVREWTEPDKGPSLKLYNKLPEWNEELQSLVLRFNKGRVLAPSAKNFLMCIANDDNREGVLQFGKTRKKRYALDFRYPMSPLQAFGVCLSLFNWSV